MPAHHRLLPLPLALVAASVAALVVGGFTVAAAAASATEEVGGAPDFITEQSTHTYVDPKNNARRRRISAKDEAAIHQWRSKVFPTADDHEPPRIHLDYGSDHPFGLYGDRNVGSNRELQQQKQKSKSKYRRMRMYFNADPIKALKGQYGEVIDKRIDFIIDEVLPKAADIWTDALSVVPNRATFDVPRGFCGGAVTKSFTVPSDADVVVMVESNLDMCAQADGTIAAAYPCLVDQYDRPVLGVISFCLNGSQQKERIGSERKRFVETALHELGHVLGFVDEFMKYFRDGETGAPLTPRPFRTESVKCVDGTRRNVVMPPFLREGVTASGAKYFEVGTPRVAQVVRNQFDCQDLDGARLETQPTSRSCFGSHLDERLFYTELMGAVYTDTSVLSALTLAFLEDTGWYKSNYTNAGVSTFGHRAGCSFVNENCIVDGNVPPYAEGFFCDTALGVTNDGIPLVNVQKTTCDPTHRKKAACDLIDRSRVNDDLLYEAAELPGEYQYFEENTKGPGVFTAADFCPIATMELQDCRDGSNSGQYEFFGESSFCYNSFYRNQFGQRKPFSPLCLNTKCNAADRTIEILRGGRTAICREEDQGGKVTLPGTSLRIACPRFDVVCAELVCPANCSGRGICKRDADGAQRCTCFDTSDTSAGCFGYTMNGGTANIKFPTPAPTRSFEKKVDVELTDKPTQRPTYGYAPKEDESQQAAIPTERPTFDYPDDPYPTTAPSEAPVVTLYGNGYWQGRNSSSSASKLTATIAFLCTSLLLVAMPL